MRLFQQSSVAAGMFAVVISTFIPQQAEAVPAFARQTGMACVSCHAQNFPALNSFGRSFKAQGYTMRGAAPLIEGDDLSMPADLKASLITKLRYSLTENVDGGRGEIQWPDEAALLIGGRAAENIGFLFEGGLAPQAGHSDTGTGAITGDTNNNGIMDAGETWVADTGTGETEVDGNFLSYKVQVNITDKISAVVFGTDGLGVGYSMELMNTGMQRSQRPIENRKGFSAFQRTGLASGAATGISAIYHTNNLMVNYSHWAPTWGNVNANILGGLGHYVRANYFRNLGGWDMGFGASYMTGKIETGANDPAVTTTIKGRGVDFQALGELGGKPAEFYLSYAVAPENGPNSAYNNGADDIVAVGLLGKIGIANRTSAYLAYGTDDNGTRTVSDTTLGVQYMLAQNAKVELYTVSSDKDGGDLTMLQLFSGF